MHQSKQLLWNENKTLHNSSMLHKRIDKWNYIEVHSEFILFISFLTVIFFGPKLTLRGFRISPTMAMQNHRDAVVFLKLSRVRIDAGNCLASGSCNDDLYEALGSVVTFEVGVPQFVLPSKLPFDHQHDEILAWPHMRFAGHGVVRTAEPPIEFACHTRFLVKPQRQHAAASHKEKAASLSEEAIQKLLDEYPWLRREDLVEPVKRSVRKGCWISIS